MSEASPEFKQLLQDACRAVEVGQTFTFRRTFTDGDVALFCGVTERSTALHEDGDLESARPPEPRSISKPTTERGRQVAAITECHGD